MSPTVFTPTAFEYNGENLPLSDKGTGFAVEKTTPDLKPLEVSDIDLELEIDRKAKFLSFAGIWKDVDTEKMKKEIAALRKRSARPIKKL